MQNLAVDVFLFKSLVRLHKNNGKPLLHCLTDEARQENDDAVSHADEDGNPKETMLWTFFFFFHFPSFSFVSLMLFRVSAPHYAMKTG